MKTYRARQCIILIFSCLPACTTPGQSGIDETASHYLSPSEVTADDYRDMAAFGASYDQCLAHRSRIEAANYRDPRHVIDAAMKYCATELEELNAWFETKKFPPKFRQGYVTQLSRRSVRKLFPEVIFFMSIKR